MPKGRKHKHDKVIADARNSSFRLGANRQLQQIASEVMQARERGDDLEQPDADAREAYVQLNVPRGPAIMR